MVKQDKKKNINILIIQILALVLVVLGFTIGMGPAMSRQMGGENVGKSNGVGPSEVIDIR